jgi:ParB family chromosome partitioning protein
MPGDDAALLADVRGNTLAAELLGVAPARYGRSDELAELTEKASEARAQVLTLFQVLASYEAATSRNDWRHVSGATARYLRFRDAQGYTLADSNAAPAARRRSPTRRRPAAAWVAPA